MAKGLFLLLFSSFIGIFINPDFLSADRAIDVKQPNFNAVETVVIEPKSAPELGRISNPVQTYTTVESVSTPATALRARSMQESWRSTEKVKTCSMNSEETRLFPF